MDDASYISNLISCQNRIDIITRAFKISNSRPLPVYATTRMDESDTGYLGNSINNLLIVSTNVYSEKALVTTLQLIQLLIKSSTEGTSQLHRTASGGVIMIWRFDPHGRKKSVDVTYIRTTHQISGQDGSIFRICGV